MRCCLRLFALFAPLLSLVGCGIGLNQPIANQPVSGLSGSTFGGQQPIVGATVTLWAVGTSGYGTGATQIASATAPTNVSGNFTFGTFTCPYANTPTYLLSSGGNAGGGVNAHIVLASASGACGNLSTALININEVTTAATAYAMSHFFTTTLGGAYTTDLFGGHATGSGTYNAGLVNADLYTVPMLVDLTALPTAAARTTFTSGTLTTTLESAKLYSIANTLAVCVNASTASNFCANLFSYTNDNGGPAPTDTLQAAVQMAIYPYKNVSSLYTLPAGASPFVGLASAPNDWSLGVSYTSTAFQLGILSTSTFRSSSNIDIDANGRVWFPTNSTTSHGIGEFNPLSSTPAFSGPYLTGLVHPQYLAISNQGRIYATDTAGSKVYYTLTSSPATAGTLGYTASGFTGPILAGPANNNQGGDDILFTTGGSSTSLGTGSEHLGFTGDTATDPSFSFPPVALATDGVSDDYLISSENAPGQPCTSETEGSGNLFPNATTGSVPCYSGGAAQTKFANAGYGPDELVAIASTGGLCDFAPTQSAGSCFTSPITLSYPQGVATDGDGNMWIANYNNASVSTLGYAYNAGSSADFHATSTVPYLHGSSYGGTMINPVGIAIDNSGNVWVSNGCITIIGCTPGPFVLSELIGAGAPTVTPLAAGIDNSTTGTRPQAIALPISNSAERQQLPAGRGR